MATDQQKQVLVKGLKNLVNHTEVAKKLGVSRSLVSLVLSDKRNDKYGIINHAYSIILSKLKIVSPKS